MMAPVSWMPISAAATQLGLSMDEVQALVVAKVLHGRAIGGDHLSISTKSVQDYLDPQAADAEDLMSAHLATAPEVSYRGGPELDIHTEAEYERGKNT